MPRLLVESFEAVVCSIKSFPSGSLGEASDLHDIQSCPLDLCLRRPPRPVGQRKQRGKGRDRAVVFVGGRSTTVIDFTLPEGLLLQWTRECRSC